MTVAVHEVADLVVRLLFFLVSRVSTGREIVSRLTDDVTWSQLAWPVAGVLLVSLVAGAWTAFWDD
ncbi:MAG TPA: hypothetical protein VGC57_03485 [Cellulomonas sp.]